MMSKFQRFLKLFLLVVIGLFLSFVILTFSVNDYNKEYQVHNILPLPNRVNILPPKNEAEKEIEMRTATEDNNTSRPQTMVVILTYMRSGSTFTGDLIQRSPDVFYVFEPLWSLQHLLNANIKPIHIQIGAAPRNLQSTKTLENFLTCNMKDADIYTQRQYHMKNSLDTQAYYDCILQNPGIVGTLDCLRLIEKPCRASRVSCVKTIRFAMKDMKNLLSRYPEMKVLHLIRDPRATLRSQRNVGEFHWEDIKEAATKLCTRVETDLKDSVKLKSKYPGKIATLRYEDLVEDTDSILEQIYTFLGLDLTDEIREYVHNITTGSKPKCGALCTSRNSTEVVSKWRQALPFKYVSVIDGICGSLYEKVGYLPAKSEESLKNLEIPVYTAAPEKLRLGHH